MFPSRSFSHCLLLGLALSWALLVADFPLNGVSNFPGPLLCSVYFLLLVSFSEPWFSFPVSGDIQDSFSSSPVCVSVPCPESGKPLAVLLPPTTQHLINSDLINLLSQLQIQIVLAGTVEGTLSVQQGEETIHTL